MEKQESVFTFKINYEQLVISNYIKACIIICVPVFRSYILKKAGQSNKITHYQ